MSDMNRRELLQSLGAVGLTVIGKNADQDVGREAVTVEAGPPILAVLSYPRELSPATCDELRDTLHSVLRKAGLDIPAILLTNGMTLEFVRRNQVVDVTTVSDEKRRYMESMIENGRCQRCTDSEYSTVSSENRVPG